MQRSYAAVPITFETAESQNGGEAFTGVDAGTMQALYLTQATITPMESESTDPLETIFLTFSEDTVNPADPAAKRVAWAVTPDDAVRIATDLLLAAEKARMRRMERENMAELVRVRGAWEA